MAGNPKFLIGEQSGVEFDVPTEYVPDSTDQTFDDSTVNFTAANPQEAFEALDGKIDAKVFGEDYDHAQVLPILSTTSTTFINFITLSASVNPGTYRITWSTEASTSNGNNRSMEINVDVDGTNEAAGRVRDTANTYLFTSGEIERTFGSAATVDIELNFRAVSGTARLRNGRVSIWRVS